MAKFRLRTKFLLSLLAISAGLTSATLLVVRYRLEKQVRNSISENLRNSVSNYQGFERLREAMLVQSARLIADLPLVRALMTSKDQATVQDGSAHVWQLSGSDLLLLVDGEGKVLGFHSKEQAANQQRLLGSLQFSLAKGDAWDWWFDGKHLYQVWIQPIYFGKQSQESLLGFLAIGDEIEDSQVRDLGNVTSSEIVFVYGREIAASTLSADQNGVLEQKIRAGDDLSGSEQEIRLGSERYLANTVRLSSSAGAFVTLSVLKSFDRATAFLRQLNGVLLVMGLVCIAAASLLAVFVAHTITKPLASLVAGVRALEKGDSTYPLSATGSDEIHEVTKAFVRMRSTLQKSKDEQEQLEQRLRQAHKMEAVGRLAGGVAHDFNNLLTIINGHSELLSDRLPGGDTGKHNLEQIRKAAGRAVAMTRQLLAFSRKQVLEPQIIDVNSVVAEMGKMLPRLIGENIEYKFDAGAKLALVKADPGQIEQVIMNLVVNSRDAMPTGGSIVVRTQNAVLDQEQALRRHPMEPGEYVLLTVEDTGHGMDEDTKAHIFEPFFTTKELGKGTGLGLATVYGVVKQSGGFIWVESTVGHGTKFEIYLPPTREKQFTSAPEKRTGAVPRGNETVLVVEDEDGVRELACEFLRTAGYSVLEAQNGAEALPLIEKEKREIHLVLCDVVMPKMGGVEFGQQLKRMRPGIKLIFMSGYTEYSAAGEAKNAPLAVLQKPFSFETLVTKVRNVLADSSPENPSALERSLR